MVFPVLLGSLNKGDCGGLNVQFTGEGSNDNLYSKYVVQLSSVPVSDSFSSA
jgi:hypothetical protein